MTNQQKKAESICLPPLKPRKGGDISALYQDIARDPDIIDNDFDCRARLARYGELVRAARKQQGMTQKQLSDTVGMSQARISMIESGTMDEGPTFRTMARLESVLGVQIPQTGEFAEPVKQDVYNKKIPA